MEKEINFKSENSKKKYYAIKKQRGYKGINPNFRDLSEARKLIRDIERGRI